jgi:Tol biopolymer transport system component
MVVSPDGSGLAQVTPEPLDELLTWTFSPDGRDVLAVTQGEGRPAILILPVDGASPPRVLDVVALADEPVDYRPPDGHELLVVTKPDVGKGRAIEAVDLESGAARTIVAASLIDVFGAGWSPTGDYVTYQAYEAGGVRGHIVGADGQGDRLVDPASTAGSDFAEIWSNDGTLLALRSRAMDGAPDLWSIVSVDGSRPRVEVRCDPAAGVACPDGLNWSPDDSTLIGCICVEDESARYVLVDPATGRMTELALPGDGGYDWQRRAP